jgi:intracellular protein transport protein USO1
MEFLSQTYTALRGPTGNVQTPSDAIQKLTGRLSQSTMLPDRRAAVLALKGLTRDCKKEIGERCMPGLIEVLLNDTDVDADIAKACLECLTILCSVEGEDGTVDHIKLGMKHTEYFLANEIGAHKLFELLAASSEQPDNFYTPYYTLQFLSVLLSNRRSLVQTYFISAPDGCGTTGLLNVLGDKREILRNGQLLTMSV